MQGVRRYNGAKNLHNPAERHKEGALHFTSVWGRTTIRVIKGPPLTKALSKMSTSSQKKDQMSFPDKPFAPAGIKKKPFLVTMYCWEGINPLRVSKAKSARKYTFALILTSFSGALIGLPTPSSIAPSVVNNAFQTHHFSKSTLLAFSLPSKKTRRPLRSSQGHVMQKQDLFWDDRFDSWVCWRTCFGNRWNIPWLNYFNQSYKWGK